MPYCKNCQAYYDNMRYILRDSFCSVDCAKDYDDYVETTFHPLKELEEQRFREAFDEPEPEPRRNPMWKYVPVIVIAVVVALLATTAFAAPRPISNTVLCDEQAQLVDILEASGKSGQFEDTRNRLLHYGSIKNKYNEPVCAFIQNPVMYELMNEFKVVRTFSPGLQDYQNIYVAKVMYMQPDGMVVGYIGLSEEALQILTGGEPVQKQDL